MIKLWTRPILMSTPICRGNRHVPKIALTFDDGPDSTVTPLLLNLLKKHGVKATFFCLGVCVNAHQDLVRREAAECHAIGTHAYTHGTLYRMTDQEILDTLSTTNDAIKSATGKTPTYFRPPYGTTSRHINDLAEGLGLAPILWTGWSDFKKALPCDNEFSNGEAVLHDYDGWSIEAMTNVLMSAQNGWIFLCHDAYSPHDRDRTDGIDKGDLLRIALDESIPKLQQKGFEFVTIPELLAD